MKKSWGGGGGRKNDLNFTELVSFLPFTLNKRKKKLLPHGRKRKRKE
jgi:hypothetical protein